jgi:hypothetical protein
VSDSGRGERNRRTRRPNSILRKQTQTSRRKKTTEQVEGEAKAKRYRENQKLDASWNPNSTSHRPLRQHSSINDSDGEEKEKSVLVLNNRVSTEHGDPKTFKERATMPTLER